MTKMSIELIFLLSYINIFLFEQLFRRWRRGNLCLPFIFQQTITNIIIETTLEVCKLLTLRE